MSAKYTETCCVLNTKIIIIQILLYIQNLNFFQKTGKSPLHFQKYGELAQELCSMFWPREMEFEIKIDDPSTFERYDDLTRRLSFLELSLEELKQKYYEARYRRQQSSQANKTQHGAITVCLCYVEDTASLVMELLNARNLKSYDSNSMFVLFHP